MNHSVWIPPGSSKIANSNVQSQMTAAAVAAGHALTSNGMIGSNPIPHQHQIPTMPSPINAATSQMAMMSLTGGPQNPGQIPQAGVPQGHTATNQIVGNNGYGIPLPTPSTTAHHNTPINVPGSLNLFHGHTPLVDSVGGVGGGGVYGVHSQGLMQSPVSPLGNTAVFYPQNLAHNQVVQPAMGSPVTPNSPLGFTTTPISTTLASNLHHAYYGSQNQPAYPNTPGYSNELNNNTNTSSNNNHHPIGYLPNQQLSQQQLQLLLQQQQQQLYQQQLIINQSTAGSINTAQNPLISNISGVSGVMTNQPLPSSFPDHHNINASQQYVPPELKPHLGTLPHSLPTTLNPSLKQKTRIRGVLNSSTGSMSPLSPRNCGQFQDDWDIYEEANTSGVGSSLCSPSSPGSAWTDYVVPRYEAPSDKNQCLRCDKRVYAMEKVGPVRDGLYHKNCFTCVACGTKLNLKNFHHNANDSYDLNVFCSSHKPRVTNVASDVSAMYVARANANANAVAVAAVAAASPRTPGSGKARDQASGPEFDFNGTQDKVFIGPPPTSEQPPQMSNKTVNNKYTSEPNSVEQKTCEVSVTNATVSQENTQTATPQGSSKSVPSNSGSSPFSSVSSSSSYATSLKAEGQGEFESGRARDNDADFLPEVVRRDRPSTSSVSSTSSAEIVMKTKLETTGEKDDFQVEEEEAEESFGPDRVSLGSNSSVERPDRPSVFQRSFSNNDPQAILGKGKSLVKSQSSHEFSTFNDLKSVVEPRRLLPRNESMRMDRPSQFNHNK